jgi:hypothetical protein
MSIPATDDKNTLSLSQLVTCFQRKKITVLALGEEADLESLNCMPVHN